MTTSPLIIVGNPRSGTSMLRLMLTCHPSICIPPEGPFMELLYPEYGHIENIDDRMVEQFVDSVLLVPKMEEWHLDRRALIQRLRYGPRGSMADLVDGIFRAYMERSGSTKTRWGEKSGSYTLRGLYAIRALFPNAFFLHIVRDGRDVACSYRSVQGLPGKYAPQLPNKILEIAWQWNANVGRIRAFLEKCDESSRMEVRYEDLVTDTETTLRCICGKIGEEFDARMLDFHRQNAALGLEPKSHLLWKEKTLQPVSQSRVGRWQQDLAGEELCLFEAAAGKMLAHYGYARQCRSAGPVARLKAWMRVARFSVKRSAQSKKKQFQRLRARMNRWKRKMGFLYRGRFGHLPCPEKWVFIVGCYNSGTTLLHEMLAAHPDVGSMPDEGQYYTDELVLPKSVGLPRLWAIEPERFRLDEDSGREVNAEKLKRQWGAKYNDPKRRILLEKSPTNAGRTRWLQEHFKHAHFIGIIRNGYAVAEGIHRKQGHPLGIAARQWACSNEIMLRDFDMLRDKKIVRYEQLVDDPEGTLRDVLAFLGLDVRQLNLEGKDWKIHELKSPIRNMNAKSLAVLDSDQRKIIESEAGDLLQELGYAEPSDEPS